MNYYQDITLLPDAEIGPHFLWQKFYQQIHLAFVEMKDEAEKVSVGISFPEYFYVDSDKKSLGKKLRIFSPEKNQLENLDIRKWLSRLSDYVHVTSIREVPEKISAYACFSRVQVKSNVERLARRKAQHEKINLEEAMKKLEKVERETSSLPFIHLRSLSGGQDFRLFIKKTVMDKPVEGSFSLYGLSSTATVPDF